MSMTGFTPQPQETANGNAIWAILTHRAISLSANHVINQTLMLLPHLMIVADMILTGLSQTTLEVATGLAIGFRLISQLQNQYHIIQFQ